MKKIKISSFDISEYQIVTAVNADFDTRQTAWLFKNLIKDECGIDIPSVTDNKVGAEKEIRIGKTMFTFPKKLSLNEYIVEVSEEGTLQISAGHYLGIVAAYNKIKNLVKECEHTCEISDFNGPVDIPLTWKAHPDACETIRDKNDQPRFVKNDVVLEGFDFDTEYTLVWNDEFNGDKIDIEKWSGCPNMVMPDVELSFDEPVVVVKDNKLILTSDYNNPTPDKPYISNYTVATHDTMNFSGGYLEMRAKVPCKGVGEWPSFWLNSNDAVLYKKIYRDSHDNNLSTLHGHVEVDVFEQFSLPPYRFVPNIHKHFDKPGYEMFDENKGEWVNYRGNQLSGIDKGSTVSGTPVYNFPTAEQASDWHTYGFLWTEDMMSFSIDGVFYYSYRFDDTEKCEFNPLIRNKETKKEFYLGTENYTRENLALSVLINNMIFSPGYAQTPAGNWTKNIYDENGNRIVNWRELNLEDRDILFPLVYEIDYVRLYQTKEDKLYTPYIIGNGKKLYDGRDSQWNYAIRGEKEE